MLTNEHRWIGAIAVSVAVTVAPAWGATVTLLPNAPTVGKAIDLSVDDFERVGNCGGGRSVVNDGCSVVIKADPAAQDAYGRFSQPPSDYWIDSQDIDELKWTVASANAFTSLTFALTDAYDQANSNFSMSYNQANTWEPLWKITNRQANGNLVWLTINFDEAITTAMFLFSTKVGADYDGFGISNVSISPSPVPLPSAALLLLSGVALLGGFCRKKPRLTVFKDAGE